MQATQMAFLTSQIKPFYVSYSLKYLYKRSYLHYSRSGYKKINFNLKNYSFFVLNLDFKTQIQKLTSIF